MTAYALARLRHDSSFLLPQDLTDSDSAAKNKHSKKSHHHHHHHHHQKTSNNNPENKTNNIENNEKSGGKNKSLLAENYEGFLEHENLEVDGPPFPTPPVLAAAMEQLRSRSFPQRVMRIKHLLTKFPLPELARRWGAETHHPPAAATGSNLRQRVITGSTQAVILSTSVLVGGASDHATLSVGHRAMRGGPLPSLQHRRARDRRGQ